MSARLTSLVVAFAVVSILAGSGMSANLAEPPVAFVWAEPLVGRSSIAVERVAANWQGLDETWLLNLDVRLQNKQTATLRVERIVIRYPGSAIAPLTKAYAADDDEVALKSFGSTTLLIPETRLLAFPTPETVSVALHFRGYRDPSSPGRSSSGRAPWREARTGFRSIERTSRRVRTCPTTTPTSWARGTEAARARGSATTTASSAGPARIGAPSRRAASPVDDGRTRTS